MAKTWIALFLLLSTTCQAKFLKVAVIDTGLNLEDSRLRSKLCVGTEHTDLAGEGIEDTNNHGTHIVGLIEKYAKNTNYCIVIIKYYSEKSTGATNIDRLLVGMLRAFQIHADIINYSGGGPVFSYPEAWIINNNPNVTLVTAIGNEGLNLDNSEIKQFPACYKFSNIIAVGSVDNKGKISRFSNYGCKVKAWEMGEEVDSTVPYGYEKLSGTSQATAIYTGKLIYDRLTQ